MKGKTVGDSRANLANEIVAAFSGTPHPTGSATLSGGVPPSDVIEALQSFGGRDWMEIAEDPVLLWTQRAFIGFVSSEYFHYYFPSYLFAVLAPADRSMGNYSVVDTVVISCLPPWDSESPQFSTFEARFGVFSRSQKKVVRAVLHYLGNTLGDADARRALARYWDRV